MKYTKEQLAQLESGLVNIYKYIESEILPHITYDYETPAFGDCETWGRFNEKHGKRYTIELNGPYSEKIRFCHGGIAHSIDSLVNLFPDDGIQFLKFWFDAKCFLNNKIKEDEATAELLNSFKI